MSDVAATNCGCGCECQNTGGSGCNLIFLILILCCCGGWSGGNSCGNNCGCGGGFGGDCLWIFNSALLLRRLGRRKRNLLLIPVHETAASQISFLGSSGCVSLSARRLFAALFSLFQENPHDSSCQKNQNQDSSVNNPGELIGLFQNISQAAAVFPLLSSFCFLVIRRNFRHPFFIWLK